MKNLAITLLVFLSLVISPKLFAQNVSVNADGSLADTSAMLDVSSTTKGFLLPRMTTSQQNSIILPATGLTIFNTTLNGIMINTGTALSPIWSGLVAGAIDTSSIANFSIKIRSLFSSTAPITYSNGLIGITQSGTSTNGYLSSTDWNTFNNKAAAFSTGNLTETGSGVLTITGGTGSVIGSGTTVQVKQATTSQNGFLTSTDWNTFNNKQPQLNGTGFVKATGTTISYDNSTYLSANQTITFAPTGDVTGSTTGTTTIAPALVIGTNKVLNTMLAKMPTLTIKGNNTGGAADPLDLTVAQVNAILPVFTSTLNGLVPFSGGSAGKVLHGDGIWRDTASASNSWSITGNTGTSYLTNFLGTTDNKSLRFRTNNTQGMILDSLGNASVGASTTTLDATNPEKFLVNAGTTTSVNAIVGKGSINSYLQLNIQNQSSGTSASSDVVATANNGNETSNYVDMGINGGSNTSGVMGVANDAYFYNLGQNLFIGTGTAAKSLIFMTGGTDSATNQRMRIDGNGNVGIGTSTPTTALHVVKNNTGSDVLNLQNTSASGYSSADFFSNTGVQSGTFGFANSGTGVFFTSRDYFAFYGNDFLMTADGSTAALFVKGSNSNVGISNTTPSEKLDVTGNIKFSGALMPNNLAGTAGYVLTSNGAGTAPTWTSSPSNSWAIGGNSVASVQNIGTTSNFDFPFITNNTEKMRLTSAGSLGIGTTTFNGTFPERLLVDAGSPSTSGDYQNVIVGKGNTNSYAQLNIQNNNAGTIASSDVVATANNGSESVNYIDMGINSGSNTSSGIYGAANTGYLYTTGNDFAIGNATASKNLVFFTGGTASANERLRIDGSGNVGIGTTSPASTLDVNGSVGYAITTTATNLTLSSSNYSVIITGGTPTITLPAAASNNRKIFVIVNQTGAGRTTSAYLNFSGTSVTAVGANSSITVQSNGTSWYRIQ